MLSYDHDGLNRMTAIRANGGPAVSFGYDRLGRRETLTRANGTSTSYAHDGASRLKVLTNRFPADPAKTQQATFAYNRASQIVTRSADNDAYAFTALAAGTTPYARNGLNQYTAVDGAAVTHDANGNLETDPGSGSGAGGGTTFAYDVENRLIGASGATNASLAYDPLGRLWQISAAGATTRFLYDGDRLVEERDGAGNLLRKYAHGPGVDEPLVQYEGLSIDAPRWLHADERGSIVATSNGAGAVTAINRYDEYGQPQSSAGTGTLATRFGYTGQTWLPEVKVYYYKARMYRPRDGRFMQVDPIGYDDGLNLYAYVNNNPVNRADPSGLAGCDRSLNSSQCNQAMQAQKSALQRVQVLRSDLAHLREQRRDRMPGIDARAKATEAALRANFGSSLNSVVRAVDANLGKLETFYSDPGSAAGGMFDYRAPTKNELALGAGSGIGFHNPGYRPNTVALNIRAGDAPTEIRRTFVHEPLHVFGMSRPWLGEQYRGAASTLANMRGGTATAVYNNPENYACFAFPTC